MPSIVRPALPSDPMALSTFPTIYADGFIELFIRGELPAMPVRGTPCPSATAPAGDVVAAAAKPPEGTHPDAGAPLPEGVTQDMVALGDRVYHGQVGRSGLHRLPRCERDRLSFGSQSNRPKWLWSDGSFAGIVKSITEGVPTPKQYRSPMPPMGGAQLTPEQTKALAAYVWSLGHAKQ